MAVGSILVFCKIVGAHLFCWMYQDVMLRGIVLYQIGNQHPHALQCNSLLMSMLQGLLCGVIQVIVQKLSEAEEAKAGVLQYADHIMEALLHVFACRKDTVHEEAMLAVVSDFFQPFLWCCYILLNSSCVETYCKP